MTASACGTTQPLTGLTITGKGTWIVVGDGGFVARSPDGTWYSRVDAGVEADLEAIGVMADGTIAIAGDHGQLLVSADDARTWRVLLQDPMKVRAKVLDLGQIQFFSVIQAILQSGNGRWENRVRGGD